MTPQKTDQELLPDLTPKKEFKELLRECGVSNPRLQDKIWTVVWADRKIAYALGQKNQLKQFINEVETLKKGN